MPTCSPSSRASSIRTGAGPLRVEVPEAVHVDVLAGDAAEVVPGLPSDGAVLGGGAVREGREDVAERRAVRGEERAEGAGDGRAEGGGAVGPEGADGGEQGADEGGDGGVGGPAEPGGHRDQVPRAAPPPPRPSPPDPP